jgi:predicted MFS family arabinose efflux permease
MCLWFCGNAAANTFAGLIAYGIGNIHSSLAIWRVLFLILGGVTTAYALLLIALLPDSPSKAWFLTKEERLIALHRTVENKTGVLDEETFKVDQMWEAFRDPQAWLLAFFTFCQNIPNGGLGSVSNWSPF